MRRTAQHRSNVGQRWPVFAPAKPAYMPSMAITWARRLKRVFNIDIETCKSCGGDAKIIACIRLQGKDCSYNPFAFPPSLEVRCRRYDPREGGGRAKQEPEPRATQGAVAESRFRAEGRNRRNIALNYRISSRSGPQLWPAPRRSAVYTVSAYGTDLALVQGRVFVHPNLRS